MTKWTIVALDDEARRELAFLFEDTAKARDVRALLLRLADQEDPRHPAKDADLDVKEVEHDAPNWYRLRIDAYGLRILFRLLIVRGGRTLWLGNRELPIGDDEPLLELTEASDRSDAYGKKARQRYRKINKP